MSPAKSAVIGNLGRAVAAELRAETIRKGVTQAELATVSGISQSQLSRQFRGLRAIHIDELATLCAALEIPLKEFISHAVGRQPTPASVSELPERNNLVAGLEPVANEPLEENQP